jgi:hypothetical protein
MRRISRVLAFTTAALIPAPLILLGQALPASAAGGSLVVTTIARNGHGVSSSIVAVNLAGDTEYDGTSGHAFNVPNGHYALLSAIQDATTGTLAGKLVTVSGRTSVTLDARAGRLIKVTLNGKAVDAETDARVCAGISQVELFGTANSVFAVPNSSKVFSFAYLATGQWAQLSALTSGVPASPGGAWGSSSLARLTLSVHSGEQDSYDTDATLQPEEANGVNCQTDLTAPLDQQAAPYRVSTLVSPGRWIVRTDDFAQVGNQGDDTGGFMVPVNFVKGRSDWLVYYAAAWGPTGWLPMIWRHSIEFFPSSTITDPDGEGYEAGTMNTIALSLNGHELAKRNVSTIGNSFPDFAEHISGAGWYTLTVDASRYYPGISFPGTILTPRATLSWHFYASPGQTQAAPVYLATLVPQDLSMANKAVPRSVSTVRVYLSRPSNPNVPTYSDSVKSVQVWESVTAGANWAKVTVKHTSSGWTAYVRNPVSGFVTLRSEVTDTHGDTSTETIYRAYGI